MSPNAAPSPSPESAIGSASRPGSAPQPGSASQPGSGDRRPVGRAGGLSAGGLAILLAAGYAAACAIAPLPEPVVTLDKPTTVIISADDAAVQEAVDSQSGPTAVGWLHDDEIWTNSQSPAPIASISKLVTVLVALDAQPVAPGADGPTHAWTAEDAALQAQYLADDGVAFPIPVGTEVTARQMLQLALVPSANDFAAAYAYSVFGSNDAFLAAVRAWQDREGLDSLSLFEPTGMDERNAASASDVLRLARLALANDTVSEIVAMPQASLPWGIGTVENTNPLYGAVDGVIGLKTGRTSVAGYNLAAARTSDALGRDVVQLSVVLGRATAEDRLSASLQMFSALDAAPARTEIIASDERLGTARTIDGVEIPILISGDGVSTVLLPGETAERTASLASGGFSAAGEPDAGLTGDDSGAGQVVGSVRVSAPGASGGAPDTPSGGPGESGDIALDVVTGADITAPDYGWRLTHPRELFTWS